MTIPMTNIDAPPRSPRPNTSLDVLPVHDVSNDHFFGFVFQADPCAFPNVLPKDCYIQIGTPAGTAKTFGDPGNNLVTQVFGVYQGVECFLNGGIDDFVQIAERVLENGEHRVVDGALAATLLTEAEPTTPAAVDSVVVAIGVLEQYLAAQVPGQGYIYLSPLVATVAVSEHLLTDDLGGGLRTYLGTPVVVLTEPSMIAMAYASGPVNIWRGPVVANRAPDVTHNLGRGLAERLYSLAIECGVWSVDLSDMIPDVPEIIVAPGSTQTVNHDDPYVVPDPTTAWAAGEFATFADGDFYWEGEGWAPYYPPVTTLTVAAPTTAEWPDPIQATITTDVVPPPGVTVSGQYENPVTAGMWISAQATQPTADPKVFTFVVGTSTIIPPVTLHLRAVTNDLGVTSPTVNVNLTNDVARATPGMGWTVAELKQFAADHDPAIELQSSWNKQEILDAILAVLEHDAEEP